jgi:hypothetical protein
VACLRTGGYLKGVELEYLRTYEIFKCGTSLNFLHICNTLGGRDHFSSQILHACLLSRSDVIAVYKHPPSN